MNICLEQYHDVLECKISSDDICLISVTENSNKIIYDLPINSNELYISRSHCTSFSIPENTAKNLKIIWLHYTNLTTLPIISHYHQLHSCTITHSNINSFHGQIPKKLVELNLRWNVITSFDFTVALQLQKSDLNNNHFTNYTCIEGNGRTFTYLQQNTYVHNKMTLQNRKIVIEKVIEARNTNPIGIEATLFSDQSVHLSSINKSVHKSYNNLSKMSFYRDPIHMDLILYLHSDIRYDTILSTIECLDIGKVHSIEMRHDEHKTNIISIHFDYWYRTKASNAFQKRITNNHYTEINISHTINQVNPKIINRHFWTFYPESPKLIGKNPNIWNRVDETNDELVEEIDSVPESVEEQTESTDEQTESTEEKESETITDVDENIICDPFYVLPNRWNN